MDHSLGDEATRLPSDDESLPDLSAGEVIDRYRVVRLLGRGGMGQVYEVEHETLGTRHALKIIPHELAGQRGFIDRFRREATVMAKLQHPGIVHVSDFAHSDGRYWLLMELVKGVPVGEPASSSGVPPLNSSVQSRDASATSRAISLADLAAAKDGKLDQSLLADLLCQVLEALAYAHEKGTVHRDLKPGNILLDEPSKAVSHLSPSVSIRGETSRPVVARISDFGLVRLVGEEWVRSKAARSAAVSSLGGADTEVQDRSGTSTKALLGTYEYMSPEQKSGGDVDARSDLYAIGLMAYRLVTGQQVVGFKPPSHFDSTGWDEVIGRAMEPDPENRYASAAEMRDALAAIAEEIAAESESRLEGGAPSPPVVGRGRLGGRAPSRPRVSGGAEGEGPSGDDERQRQTTTAGGDPAHAGPPSKRRSRVPAFVALVILILLALGVGGFWLWRRIEQTRVETARKQRAETYATAMKEGKGFIEKKDYAKARAAFQRALSVRGYGDDAEAKGMLEACREGAEASRKRIAYEAALRKTQAAQAKAKGTTDLKRWQEVKRLGEAALATGHSDMSAARKLLAESGRVLGVTLADMVPAQTHARRLWDRVKGLDRGQGFGRLLEQADIVRTNADAFAENKGYADAKYAYDDLAAKCEALQRLEGKRDEAKAARTQADAAVKRARTAASGLSHTPALDEAAKASKQATGLYESGRFAEAVALWSKTRSLCATSESLTTARRAMAQARTRATQAEAERRAKAALAAADRVASEALAAMKGGDYAKAKNLLARAGAAYGKARDEARAHFAAEQARDRHMAALRRQDQAKLRKWASHLWDRMNQTTAKAQEAMKQRDFARAVTLYGRAETEIPRVAGAAEKAWRADLKRRYDAAMTQGRERLKKEEFEKAEAAFRSALKLDGYEHDAEARRMVAETPRLADAFRKRCDYELALTAAKQVYGRAEGRKDLALWKKVKAFAEAAIATGHPDNGEAKRLLAKARTQVEPFPNWTAARKRIKVMTPVGEEWKEITYYKNPLGMEFVKVPAGEFQMGSPTAEKDRGSDEGPVHRVRITKPFFLQAHEVSVGQFEKFVRASGYRTEAEKGDGAHGWTGTTWKKDKKYNWRNPGFQQNANHPVACVSWNDAQAFCRWLSGKEAATCRLPTEAEWEYACRSGSRTRFFFGDRDGDLHRCGNYADKSVSLPWSDKEHDDGHAQTSPVGSYLPNAYGLYDMHGNLWEWCADWYEKDYYSKSPSADPRGPSSGTRRVCRGGPGLSIPRGCRSADRDWLTPEDRDANLGFRVSVSPPRP